MIEIKHLSKTYPNTSWALKQVHLSIDEGEIFGIIGRSGAGKSTLVRCLNLLERPSSGSIVINNQDLTQLPETQLRRARQKIGMIFQHFNLLASRTVFENIALPLELSRVDKKIANQKVNELLELVELQDKSACYPSELSGGQKQRVAIARALACDPLVLLSDEATSALDPETTTSILNLLKRINKRLKLTIVIITHEMDVVKSICDWVAVLDQGKVVEQGSVIELFARPKTELTKRLTQSALHLELPQKIQETMRPIQQADTHPIVRIAFVGRSAKEPLLSNLYQRFEVSANILQADLEFIKDSPIGVSVCEFLGDPANVKASIQYLEAQGLAVEVLGYA